MDADRWRQVNHGSDEIKEPEVWCEAVTACRWRDSKIGEGEVGDTRPSEARVWGSNVRRARRAVVGWTVGVGRG
jgi:hypothetical protein